MGAAPVLIHRMGMNASVIRAMYARRTMHQEVAHSKHAKVSELSFLQPILSSKLLAFIPMIFCSKLIPSRNKVFRYK